MIKWLMLALVALPILLVGCTSLNISREMPFVKVTVPSGGQILPFQQLVNVQANNEEEIELVLARFNEQERVIQQLQADILKMEVLIQQRQMQRPRQRQQRPQHTKPIYQPTRTFPYQAVSKAQPRRETVVQRQRKHKNDDCEFLERDLSRPQSNIVYCRPTR